MKVDWWGSTGTDTNSRSCKKGEEGNGLFVAWRDAVLRDGEAYITHRGVQDFVDGDTSDPNDAPGPDKFHFARIYGEASAYGNLPLQDYIWMKHSKKNGKHRFEMHVWKNKGQGGTKIRVDGNKYCNMMGHEDGRADYVWTFQGGKMEIYKNRGKSKIDDDDPEGFWDPAGTIWEPPREMHRKDLHLADWDGDGDCDIIYVDPNNDNAIEVWLNEKPGSWEWKHLENPAPGITCSQERGIGIHDLAVRFADLNGNKHADYLCIKPDGEVSAYLHPEKGDDWEDLGQIKFAENRDRANLRWADVDGDGRDDMLWVDKFSGDTLVW